MNAVTQLLQDLVARPSINPAFVDDPAVSGEERVAELLIDRARQAGLDIRRQAVLPGRKNLLVRLSPAGKVQRRIILAPHMDVVPAEANQFKPVIKNGRLHGRGACDTKGSMSSFFQSLCDVAKSGRRPQHTEILFVGLVDEECNQAGSRKFSQAGPKGDLAIAGEPTMLQTVTAHKGDLWWRLTAQGKAAHGATPHLGKNAIHTMARVVDVLETEYAKLLRQRSHPLLGSPTCNVGVIRGGTQPNIVPEQAWIDIDRRTLPGETATGVWREIRTLLNRHGLKIDHTDLKGVDSPALETDPQLPLVQEFLRASRRRKTLGVHYFTDAAPITSGGTPAIVFGPGNIAQAHTTDEWLDLKQLDQAVAIVTRFLRAQP